MLQELVAMMDEFDSDVMYDVDGRDVDVRLCDFVGFDDHWHEEMRDYDHPELVEQFLRFLEECCVSQEGDFYVIYHFEDCDVRIGYTSFDI